MSTQAPKGWRKPQPPGSIYYDKLPNWYYSGENDRPYFSWDGDGLRLLSGKITCAEVEVQSFMKLTAHDSLPCERIVANYIYLKALQIFADYYRFVFAWDEINMFRTHHEQRVDIIVLQRLKDRALAVCDMFEECVLHIADLINIKARMARPVYSNYCLLGIIAGMKNMDRALQTHGRLWLCGQEAIRVFRVVKSKSEVIEGSDYRGMIDIVYEERKDHVAELGDEVKLVKRTKKVKGGKKCSSKGQEKMKAKERLEEYRKLVLKGGKRGDE